MAVVWDARFLKNPVCSTALGSEVCLSRNVVQPFCEIVC